MIAKQVRETCSSEEQPAWQNEERACKLREKTCVCAIVSHHTREEPLKMHLKMYYCYGEVKPMTRL